jgi:4-hydroxythreonine-4-phosphate dehydrogenase
LERRFGIARPRLALLGINPHAGESGLLGHEDADVVAATVALGAAEGLSLSGPHPADTWFRPGFEGAADCVVAMYHDQGLLPVKCLAFGSAVNVTLGLPIVRTSVDHGTAFDIAGKGSADAGSMAEALRFAARLAARSAGS